MIGNKIIHLIKYITIYSIFIILTLITKIPGRIFDLFRLFPDFNIIFLFLVTSWVKDDIIQPISKNNFFIFGLIIDNINSLPLGLSSLSLLLSIKLSDQFRKYFLDDDTLFYFVRDVGFFLFFYILFEWFIISFYENSFYPINIGFNAWLRDMLASYFVYFLYNKFRNHV